MSHSQFRFTILILRHAWLNFQVKLCRLAGSTRFRPYCRGPKTLREAIRFIVPFGSRFETPRRLAVALPVLLATC